MGELPERNLTGWRYWQSAGSCAETAVVRRWQVRRPKRMAVQAHCRPLKTAADTAGGYQDRLDRSACRDMIHLRDVEVKTAYRAHKRLLDGGHQEIWGGQHPVRNGVLGGRASSERQVLAATTSDKCKHG